MAKFLDTTGISYHLQQMINNAKERLILISPYLKINERLKQSLEDKDRMKIDIRIVYGKNELQPEENNWLKSMTSIRTSFCKNLHSKCYLNEKEAIITSMNLYEFSQVHNNEMGIYVERESDPELFQSIYDEVQRLIRNSDEIVVSVEKSLFKETNINQHAPITHTNQDFSNQKYMSATAISKTLGIAISDFTAILIEEGLIIKNGKDSVLTEKGKSTGGALKNSKYGEYISWPESITEILKINAK
jgi:phosphatidylserine/phosphatidylglycerophosphate/cardiolipin synthase-like enzyme